MSLAKKQEARSDRGRLWSVLRREQALALLFLAALALRVIYLCELAAKSPFWGHPYLDAAYYLSWAQRILSGEFIGREVFIRAPLYPYFLALVGRIAGLTPAAIGAVQALLGALTCLLVALLGRRAFSPRAGLVAGWLACVSGPLIYWGGETLIETFLLPLVLFALWFTLRGRNSGRVGDGAAAGLFAGLAGIARPTALVVLPVVLSSFLFGPKEGRPPLSARLRLGVIALICGGGIIGLVCLRNAVIGGDFVPVASHGGINFWTGNNARTDGKLVVVPAGIEVPPERKGEDNLIAISVVGAEKAMGRKLKPSEVSSYWTGQALGWMRAHPLAALHLYARKIYYFWAGCETTNNEDIYCFRRFSLLLSLLLLPLGPVYLPGALLMPLALYGLVLSARSFRRLFPLYAFLLLTFALVVAFFVSSRHRLPILPLALIFASAGALRLIELTRGRDHRLLIRHLVLFLPLLLLFGINPGARPAGTLAQYRQFEYATWIKRGEESKAAGLAHQAAEEFTRALALRPGDAETHYELGVLLGEQGGMREARIHLEEAARLVPREPRYLYALGIWHVQNGEPGRAREVLTRAAALGAKVPPELMRSLAAEP
jgi:tetratricopeptide (TPR) repeat protein